MIDSPGTCSEEIWSAWQTEPRPPSYVSRVKKAAEDGAENTKNMEAIRRTRKLSGKTVD